MILKSITEIRSHIGDFKFVHDQYKNRKRILDGAQGLQIELAGIATHIVRLDDIIYDLEKLDTDNEDSVRSKWVTIYKENREDMLVCQEMGFSLKTAFCKESEDKYLGYLWFLLD